MSRLPAVALASLLIACASGEARIEAPTDVAPGSSSDATLPLLSASVGGGCDASVETPPHNACDGEAVLGLDVVSLQDADGDGVWEAGEALDVELSLFTTLEDDGSEQWVNYPGVFADLPDGVRLDDGTFREDIAWFYAVSPDQPLTLHARLVADQDVAGGTELVFTVGSLNCEENQAWGPCPTPSPLTLTVGG
jgi:hypothetical protein